MNSTKYTQCLEGQDKVTTIIRQLFKLVSGFFENKTADDVY